MVTDSPLPQAYNAGEYQVTMPRQLPNTFKEKTKKQTNIQTIQVAKMKNEF